MGFHSLDCTRCGHPALVDYVTNATNAWMTDVVAQWDNGNRVTGRYDGYGSIVAEPYGDEVSVEGADLQHLACWRAAGEPGYAQPSKSSVDQGYFFEDGAHDLAAPASARGYRVGKLADASWSGTYLVGYVYTTYARLVAVLGQPTVLGSSDGKTRAEWHVTFDDDGAFATIYDYKEYETPVEDVNHWHVGGKDSSVGERVAAIVLSR